MHLVVSVLLITVVFQPARLIEFWESLGPRSFSSRLPNKALSNPPWFISLESMAANNIGEVVRVT